MKKVLSVMVVMLMVFGMVAEVMATEASGPAMDAARKTGTYSKDVVKGSVNTVGKTTKGLGETLWSPFAAAGRWFRGEGKAKNIVVDPINKTGKTVHDTAVDTGKTVRGKM